MQKLRLYRTSKQSTRDLLCCRCIACLCRLVLLCRSAYVGKTCFADLLILLVHVAAGAPPIKSVVRQTRSHQHVPRESSGDDGLAGMFLMTNVHISCRGKHSETSDMGMYGTSKLNLLMFIPGLQQRLRVRPAVAAQPIV